MNKIIIIILILVLINLGNILDLSEKNIKKSDVIVALGGGGKNARIEESLILYEKHYSFSNYIVFTGNNKYYIRNMKIFFLKNSVLETNIISINNVSNTMEELIEIKKYLKKNNFKSVLFITHPTHMLRIKLLADFFLDYKKENININFASADHTNLWNKNLYFLEFESIKLVFLEIIKIIFNFSKYYLYSII